MEVVGADKLNEEIDLAWWHDYWHEVIHANLGAPAYWVATPRGRITDPKLMYPWLYGGVIHAQSPRSPVIRDLDIDQRYYAAAPGIARTCDRVILAHRPDSSAHQPDSNDKVMSVPYAPAPVVPDIPQSRSGPRHTPARKPEPPTPPPPITGK